MVHRNTVPLVPHRIDEKIPLVALDLKLHRSNSKLLLIPKILTYSVRRSAQIGSLTWEHGDGGLRISNRTYPLYPRD